jgi:hypothetical protein
MQPIQAYEIPDFLLTKHEILTTNQGVAPFRLDGIPRETMEGSVAGDVTENNRDRCGRIGMMNYLRCAAEGSEARRLWNEQGTNEKIYPSRVNFCTL